MYPLFLSSDYLLFLNSIITVPLAFQLACFFRVSIVTILPLYPIYQLSALLPNAIRRLLTWILLHRQNSPSTEEYKKCIGVNYVLGVIKDISQQPQQVDLSRTFYCKNNEKDEADSSGEFGSGFYARYEKLEVTETI